MYSQVEMHRTMWMRNLLLTDEFMYLIYLQEFS